MEEQTSRDGRDKTGEFVPRDDSSSRGVDAEEQASEKKPGLTQKLKSWWTGLGLDAPTVLMMFKCVPLR